MQTSLPERPPEQQLEETVTSLKDEVKTLKHSLELSDPSRYWHIKDTNFGKILEGEEGETMLPPGMWEEVVSLLETHKQGKHLLNLYLYKLMTN